MTPQAEVFQQVKGLHPAEECLGKTHASLTGRHQAPHRLTADTEGAGSKERLPKTRRNHKHALISRSAVS